MSSALTKFISESGFKERARFQAENGRDVLLGSLPLRTELGNQYRF